MHSFQNDDGFYNVNDTKKIIYITLNDYEFIIYENDSENFIYKYSLNDGSFIIYTINIKMMVNYYII